MAVQLSRNNFNFQPNYIVTALRNIPPHDKLTLSKSYLLDKATIPLVIICFSFCMIVGLYFLLYAKATIHKFVPIFEFTCINEPIEKKTMLWRCLSIFFLVFAVTGFITNFLVFFASAPLFETLTNLRSTLISLNRVGQNIQIYYNSISINSMLPKMHLVVMLLYRFLIYYLVSILSSQLCQVT